MTTFSVQHDPLRANYPLQVALLGAEFKPTQNHSGALKASRFIVLHYTAGPSLDRAIKNFADPDFDASAHLVIGPTGKVIQMVSLDQIAWHAGRSFWRPEKGQGRLLGLRRLNRFSIGIEMVNAGPLKPAENGSFRTWWGKEIESKDVVEINSRYWHRYPEEQIWSCQLVVQALMRADLGIEEILGHEDIAPRRKQDPGPAFPIEHLRAIAYGRNVC